LFNLGPLQFLCNRNGGNGIAVWTAGKQDPHPLVSNTPWYWKKGAHSREIMGYTNWYHGEPNNYGGHEDCMIMWQSRRFQWNDEPCSRHYCFVCERD